MARKTDQSNSKKKKLRAILVYLYLGVEASKATQTETCNSQLDHQTRPKPTANISSPLSSSYPTTPRNASEFTHARAHDRIRIAPSNLHSKELSDLRFVPLCFIHLYPFFIPFLFPTIPSPTFFTKPVSQQRSGWRRRRCGMETHLGEMT